MKKTLLAIAAVATLGLAVYQVADAQPYGTGYGMMMGPGYGMMGPGYGGQAPDEATLKAQEKFFKETTELRKQMTAKQAEMQAVMSTANPDPEKAAKLSEELFALREQMQAKATQSGVGTGFGGWRCSGPGMGRGMMMGPGPHHWGW